MRHGGRASFRIKVWSGLVLRAAQDREMALWLSCLRVNGVKAGIKLSYRAG